MNRNLDEMIKSYSEELMDYARTHNSESLILKITPPEEESSEGQVISEEVKEVFTQEPIDIDEPEIKKDEKEAVRLREIPFEDDYESFSYFKARVYTGLGAYGVKNANVIIYKGDILYAFLTTDKNGETERIKLEAYPEENSLEPLSDKQRIDYSADIRAEGFQERKGLLVSAVGGGDILLNAELIPVSEVGI